MNMQICGGRASDSDRVDITNPVSSETRPESDQAAASDNLSDPNLSEPAGDPSPPSRGHLLRLRNLEIENRGPVRAGLAEDVFIARMDGREMRHGGWPIVLALAEKILGTPLPAGEQVPVKTVPGLSFPARSPTSAPDQVVASPGPKPWDRRKARQRRRHYRGLDPE